MTVLNDCSLPAGLLVILIPRTPQFLQFTAERSSSSSHCTSGQVFSIGTVAAYSATYSALVAYKILELFRF